MLVGKTFESEEKIMTLADIIALIVAVAILVAGALIGFGRVLKASTKGILGIIISIVICYFFGGLIYRWGAIETLLQNFASLWTGSSNAFLSFLEKIRLEMIVYYIVLFIVVQIIRIVIVAIIKRVSESNNIVIKIFDRTLGAILFLAEIFALLLLVFQTVYWIGGSAAESFANGLGDGLLGWLFEHNPLNAFVDDVSDAEIAEEAVAAVVAAFA